MKHEPWFEWHFGNRFLLVRNCQKNLSIWSKDRDDKLTWNEFQNGTTANERWKKKRQVYTPLHILHLRRQMYLLNTLQSQAGFHLPKHKPLKPFEVLLGFPMMTSIHHSRRAKVSCGFCTKYVLYIAELRNYYYGGTLRGLYSNTPCEGRSTPNSDKVTPGFVQLSLENLQGWRLHGLLGPLL